MGAGRPSPRHAALASWSTVARTHLGEAASWAGRGALTQMDTRENEASRCGSFCGQHAGLTPGLEDGPLPCLPPPPQSWPGSVETEPAGAALLGCAQAASVQERKATSSPCGHHPATGPEPTAALDTSPATSGAEERPDRHREGPKWGL